MSNEQGRVFSSPYCVRYAPIKLELRPPQLRTDIKVAKRVASTPGGQTRADKTRTGMNATCPSTVIAIESHVAKIVSLMPKARFTPLTRISWVSPRETPAKQVQRKTLLISTFCRVQKGAKDANWLNVNPLYMRMYIYLQVVVVYRNTNQ